MKDEPDFTTLTPEQIREGLQELAQSYERDMAGTEYEKALAEGIKRVYGKSPKYNMGGPIITKPIKYEEE